MNKDHVGFYEQPEKQPVDTDKPTMFLRKGSKGGLYFFSPKGKTIYFLSGKHVQELLEGKRDFAVIHKGLKQENDHE